MPESSGAAVILASASAVRAALLRAAGLSFAVVPASLDEAALRAADPAAPPPEMALRLACAKAETVSARFPGAVVIGADQILTVDGAVLGKAETPAEARSTLVRLRGRTHELHAAGALAVDAFTVWQYVAAARLTMRDFSDTFLDAYLAREGKAVCRSVGGYEIEGRGIQLFEAIEGEYSTVLGLPLLPLLGELRRRGVLPA